MDSSKQPFNRKFGSNERVFHGLFQQNEENSLRFYSKIRGYHISKRKINFLFKMRLPAYFRPPSNLTFMCTILAYFHCFLNM